MHLVTVYGVQALKNNITKNSEYKLYSYVFRHLDSMITNVKKVYCKRGCTYFKKEDAHQTH